MKQIPPSPVPHYKNPNNAIEDRVSNLLAQMTVDEKAAQMVGVWQKKSEMLVDSDGRFDDKKAAAAFRKGQGLGQEGRPGDAGKGLNACSNAELTNDVQRFFLEAKPVEIRYPRQKITLTTTSYGLKTRRVGSSS